MQSPSHFIIHIHCSVDLIDHRREQWGKLIFLFQLHTKKLYYSNPSILLIHSCLCFITHIHCFFNLVDHCQGKQGKSSCLFWFNTGFFQSDSFRVFDAITFILHHSHSSFFYSNFLLFVNLGCTKLYWNKDYRQAKKILSCVCSVFRCEEDLVHS